MRERLNLPDTTVYLSQLSIAAIDALPHACEELRETLPMEHRNDAVYVSPGGLASRISRNQEIEISKRSITANHIHTVMAQYVASGRVLRGVIGSLGNSFLYGYRPNPDYRENKEKKPNKS